MSDPKTPPCPKCGTPMELSRVVPKLGGHPELQSFQCNACRWVETEAVESKPS
jgi:hypothetical protein